MVFNEKLDLLMTITNTKNNTLARSVSLDASFISRLRRGIRTPSKNENYIDSIALFFAKNISNKYQRIAICNALNIAPESFPHEVKLLTDIIYKWLYDQPLPKPNKVQGFLDALINSTQHEEPINSAIDREDFEKETTIDAFIYYGIEGKRSAALKFLSLVVENKKPQTLLLFSDENLEWLTSSKEFIAKWAFLLMQAIKKGNKIKIIHTVSRDFHEMLSAVKEWLSLYMTGAIEPYYYPQKRDGVFQRTLFIAPETAAVVSNSAIKRIDYSTNILFKDKKTILTFENEFNNYLSLCRPLMRTFTTLASEEFISTLWEFEFEEADALITTDTLTCITMPPGVLKSLISNVEFDTKDEKDKLLAKQKTRTENFENSLKKHNFTEIIHIPDLKTIKDGMAKVGSSYIFSKTDLFYNIDEFIAHLNNIIRLLKTYENFHIILETDSKPLGYMLYVKADVGVIIAKTSIPSVMFAINESNLIASFWDYININLVDSKKASLSNKDTIAKIEKIKEELLGTQG